MVAMIGAIVLTHRDRRRSKTQEHRAPESRATPAEHARDDRCGDRRWREGGGYPPARSRQPCRAPGEAVTLPDGRDAGSRCSSPHQRGESTDVPIGIGPYLARLRDAFW